MKLVVVLSTPGRGIGAVARSAWLAFAALILVGGCGGPPRAAVRGTVTIDGRPLTAGRIVFEQDGRSHMAQIGADGGFELRGVAGGIAPGTYSVAVLPPEPEFVPQPNSTDMRLVNPPDPRLYPVRYRVAATSGITKTVNPGESTIDVELSSQ